MQPFFVVLSSMWCPISYSGDSYRFESSSVVARKNGGYVAIDKKNDGRSQGRLCGEVLY